jgi:hypothetical protein
MDDPDLSWKAKVAAMALVRAANLDGSNCYPGALKCAGWMSVGKTTIKEGWAELKAAGYLDIMPLPAGRRRTHGATKVFKFPTWAATRPELEATWAATRRKPGRHAASTLEGNQEGTSSPLLNSPPHQPCEHCGGPLLTYNEGMDDAFVACTICNKVVRDA